MAVIEGGVSAAIQEVDAVFKAARVSIRPPEVLAWQSLVVPTGLLTAVAAGGSLFTLRNTTANPIMIRRVGVGAILTTAFGAAQRLDYGLAIARSFTAGDGGGTSIALTGNNGKHRTSLATLSSNDCRVATTAALTAGTKTLDANRIGLVGFWGGALGATLIGTPDNLLSHNAGDYPLLLAQNEGINVVNEVVMGATGVAVVYVSLEFAEVLSY